MHTPRPHALFCPECQSRLLRVPRTFTDRLISLFSPVVRYHCTAAACSWTGRLRRPDLRHARSGRSYVPRIVLDPARNGSEAPPARHPRG